MARVLFKVPHITLAYALFPHGTLPKFHSVEITLQPTLEAAGHLKLIIYGNSGLQSNNRLIGKSRGSAGKQHHI
jgi:hypothetical protein